MAELAHSTVWIDVQLNPWDALTLRIWAAHLEAAGKLEDVIQLWGDWVAGLPCEGPFDWMSWRPWEMWAWMATSQWPQWPRIPGLGSWSAIHHVVGGYAPHGADLYREYFRDDSSPWTLSGIYQRATTDWAAPRGQAEPTHLKFAPYRPPGGAGISPLDDDSRWTLPDYQWPADRYADHVATQKLLSECLHDADLRIRYRRNPDEGEVLPPDTNHGGDRIPGRYA